MNKALLATGSVIILLVGGLSAEAATTAVAPAIAATAGPVEANSQAMEAADQIGPGKISIRQQIQGQLSKNGFTNVKIMPSSFLVRATDKQGNLVEMVIGPDTFTEVTEVVPKTAAPNMPASNNAANTNTTMPAPKT